VKLLFSNSDPMSKKIILVENGEILQEETRVAEILNSYFLNITNTLHSFFVRINFIRILRLKIAEI